MGAYRPAEIPVFCLFVVVIGVFFTGPFFATSTFAPLIPFGNRKPETQSSKSKQTNKQTKPKRRSKVVEQTKSNKQGQTNNQINNVKPMKGQMGRLIAENIRCAAPLFHCTVGDATPSILTAPYNAVEGCRGLGIGHR